MWTKGVSAWRCWPYRSLLPSSAPDLPSVTVYGQRSPVLTTVAPVSIQCTGGCHLTLKRQLMLDWLLCRPPDAAWRKCRTPVFPRPNIDGSWTCKSRQTWRRRRKDGQWEYKQDGNEETYWFRRSGPLIFESDATPNQLGAAHYDAGRGATEFRRSHRAAK